jgi:hypothetical protein
MHKKPLAKIQYPFMIKKNQNKLGIERMLLNIIRDIYDKSIVNIILNGEQRKLFPLKPRIRQRCPLSYSM